jgi:hypothetical protein
MAISSVVEVNFVSGMAALAGGNKTSPGAKTNEKAKIFDTFPLGR